MADDPCATAALAKAARPFARCQVDWSSRGYGGLYTCLDREVDIANPDHETRDWWPESGPCLGCGLLRVMEPKREWGTDPWPVKVAKMREADERRTLRRLTDKYGPAVGVAADDR